MEFLSQHGIDFVEKDVRADPAAVQELIRLGSRSTPTIVVDGKVLIGFEPDKLLKAIRG